MGSISMLSIFSPSEQFNFQLKIKEAIKTYPCRIFDRNYGHGISGENILRATWRPNIFV